MNATRLLSAIDEAERFLQKATTCYKSREKYSATGIEYLPNGKLNGFVKRASLDLSRALAEMRKP